jgi:hypothetical protein
MADNESKTTTIIPAQSGWALATLMKPEVVDGKDMPAAFYYGPIIAWEIERYERPYHRSANRPDEMCISRHALPITAEGDTSEGTIPFDRTCDDEQEAIQYLLKEIADGRAAA